MKLVQSEVIFEPTLHTYQLGEKYLSGITGMIGRRIFPDKYNNVPFRTLQAAADRGSNIHELCQLYDELGLPSDLPEVQNYIKIVKDNNLVHEASEYIVSDNYNFATAIDKVYRVDDNTFDLGDIKTTYKLDRKYLSWQLSICAYFFEMQNPDAKVRNLYGIWLHGEDSLLEPISRISDMEIEELLLSEFQDIEVDKNTLIPKVYALPDKYREIEQDILSIYTEYTYWKEQKEKLGEVMMQEMVKAGSYEWEGTDIRIVRRQDCIHKRFDKDAFQKDYPKLYEKYIKEVPVAGSVTIREKKK
jgi:hypothetical protein